MSADVAEVVFYTEDAASPITVLKPAGFASGQMLIFVLGQDGAAVTDLTRPSDWSDVASVTGTGTVQAKAWSHVYTGGDPASWDFAYDPGGDVAGVLFRITGEDTTPTIVSVTTAAGPSGGTMSSPTATPTGSDDLMLSVVCIYGSGNTLVRTAPTGTVDQGSGQLLTFQAIAAATKQLSSGSATGAQQWTSITPANSGGASFTILIKSAAGAPAADQSAPPLPNIPLPLLLQVVAARAATLRTETTPATVTGTAVATLGALTGTITGTVIANADAAPPFRPAIPLPLLLQLAAAKAATLRPDRTAATVPGVAVAALGGLGATIAGTPTVLGTAAATLGGLSSTIVGTPTVTGTAAAPLGRLTGAAVVGAAAVTGTANAALGGLAATVVGKLTVPATAAAALGGLTATVIGRRTTPGTAFAPLGGAAAIAAGTRTTRGTATATLGGLTAAVSGAAASTRLTGEAHGPLPLAAGAVTVHTGTIAGAIT